VALLAVILPPRRLLGESDQIGAGNVMVMADLAAAHPAKEALRVVRVRLRLVLQAVGFLMIDPVQGEPGVKLVPPGALIGVQRRLRRDLRADEVERIGFGPEHAGERSAAALADDDDDLASAGPVCPLAAVLAILA